MKQGLKIVGMLIIATILASSAHGQCIPDTACVDIDDPGQFCPDSLPKVIVGTMYDTTVTIIAPGQTVYLNSPITILYIEIDSVKNMPPGIEYFPNATQFYPDTAYCIQITGTPTQAGEFPLFIYVSPYIEYLGNPLKVPQVVDTSSVVVTVLASSGLDPKQASAFQVFQNVPNPFSEITRIGFYTPVDDFIELKVFNILGEMMCHEQRGASPGESYFDFNGGTLMPGTYFYKVRNRTTHLTGKFIKIK